MPDQPAFQRDQVARGEVLITVRNVSKVFKLRRNEVYALRDVSVDVFCGEYLSVMGPSGSGKTTFFNMVGALDVPSSGCVAIGPMDLTRLSGRQLAYVRCNYIGYIFQAYNLIPSLTAQRNVALPRIFRGASTDEAMDAAARWLERVGLGDRLHHRPDELSGGQQQRTAIARALVNDPVIILADEPTGNLDLKTGADIIAMLKHLSVEEGVTVITATHDHKMLSNSDRVLWMRDGAVERLERREDLHIEEGQILEHGGGTLETE
jgi:putative ABC transport system ATP-binding protein